MKSNLKNNVLKKKSTKGQNVIEYLLVTAVIIFVCVVFFNPSNSPGRSALENIANDMVLDIRRLNDEIIF